MIPKIIIICAVFVMSLKHINATPEIHFKTETIRNYELFSSMISPDLFNWTSTVIEQFR